MKQLLQNRHARVAAGLLVADIVIFSTVNPRQTGAVWLIAGFLLFALNVFVGARLLTSMVRPQSTRARRLTTRAGHYGAGVVVALVGLQSIGQLTTRDIATLLPLALLGYGYLAYNRRMAASPV